MRVSLSQLLLYGNLFFFIFGNYFSHIVNFNFYTLLSLLLNIFIIIIHGSIVNIKLRYYIFFSFIILLNIYLINVAGIKALMLNLWLITSFIVLEIFLSEERDNFFIKTVKFFEIFAYIMIFDFVISYIFVNPFFEPNLGFNYLLIPNPFNKYLMIIAIPFLFYKGGISNILISILLSATLILGTRAGLISTIIVLTMSFTLIMNFKYLYNISNSIKFLFSSIIILLVFLSFNLLLNESKKSEYFYSLYSSVARIVIWSEHLEVVKNYPLGVGPGVSQNIVNFKDNNPGFIISFISSIDNEELNKEINKRSNIYFYKNKPPSEHSVIIYFISAYGLVAFLFLINLLRMLIVDLPKLFSSSYNKFKSIYIALIAILLFTLINSFHLGIFYLVLLYACYKSYRKNYEAI